MRSAWKAVLVMTVILLMGLAIFTPDNKYREEPIKDTVMKTLNNGVNHVLPGNAKLKDTKVLNKLF